MKIELKDLKVNDYVFCTGDSSFCSSDYEKVTNISIKYDENNGNPYNVIHINDRKFDGRSGVALNPPIAYYIIPTEQISAIAHFKSEEMNKLLEKNKQEQNEKERYEILKKLTLKEIEFLGLNKI